MAAFVQVQHHRESVVARHGAALHDARTVAGHLGDVTREVVPQQGVVEPARVLVRIEKVGALHLRAVAMAAERPQAAGSGRPRRQFAVIVHPIQDVLPVRSAFELRQHPREPRLRQSLGREVTHDVPHEIERFRILAVQQTVQTVFHGGKRVSVPTNIALFPRSAPFRPLLFAADRSAVSGPGLRRGATGRSSSAPCSPGRRGRSALFRAFRSFRTFGCSRRSGCSKHSGHSVVPIVPAASVVKSSRSLPSVRRFRLHPSPAATPVRHRRIRRRTASTHGLRSRTFQPGHPAGPVVRSAGNENTRQPKHRVFRSYATVVVFSPGRADRAGSSPAPSPHLRLPTAPLEATAARDSPQGTERIVRTPPSPEAAARAIRIRRYAFEPS